MLSGFFFTGPDRRSRFHAVHLRHLDIHEHNVKSRSLGAFPGRQGFATCAGQSDAVAGLFEQPDGKSLVHGIVFRKQNIKRTPFWLFLSRWERGFNQALFDGALPQGQKDCVKQLGLPDRLGKTPLYSQFVAARRIRHVAIRGKHHHHGAGKRRIGLNLLHNLETVHFRHGCVQQNNGKCPAGFLRGNQQFQGARAAVRLGRIHAPIRQHLRENFAAHRVIVHHEDIQSRKCLSGLPLLVRCGHGSFLHVAGKVKCAALPDFAFHPHAPSHQFHQLARNRQAEARSAKAARRGSVGLCKGFENDLLFFNGNAHAGVGNGNVQAHLLACDGFDFRTDEDVSLLGEFDGVSDQVHDELTQPRWISDQYSRHLGRYTGKHLQKFLFRSQGQCLECFLQQIADRKFGLFQFESARLDLGKIQNVVDDVQEAIGGRFDQVEIIPLLRCQRSIERQIGHSDNAVHRSANFMAHVGQEFALRAAARFSCFLGVEKIRLRSLPPGDVQEGDHGADDFALLADGVRPIFDWKVCPIGAPEDFFVRMNAFALPQRNRDLTRLFEVGCAVGMRVVHHHVSIPAEKIISFSMAQQAHCGRIAKRDISIAIDSKDRLRSGIQKQTNSPLTLMQRFLGALAVGHFLFQLGGALVHAMLQILAGVAQLGVASLNLPQHLVETIDQHADFILRALPCSNGIIPAAGYHLCGPRQLQDRIRDGTLQPSSHRICSQGDARDDQSKKK